MSNQKSVAIINSKAPFSSSNGQDSLDVAMVFGSYEQTISLFFHGDGVYQLIDDQQAELINKKDYLKTFSALEFYDIEKIYVCQTSLQERGLTQSRFHLDNVVTLDKTDFSDELHQHDAIFRF